MKHNKVVIACDYDFDNKKALVLMDRMLERNIDGLIFQGVHLTDEILKKLHEFPVRWSWETRDYPETIVSSRQ